MLHKSKKVKNILLEVAFKHLLHLLFLFILLQVNYVGSDNNSAYLCCQLLNLLLNVVSLGGELKISCDLIHF